MARRELGVGAILAAIVIVAAVVNPNFLSGENIRDVLVKCVPAAIIGCGVTLVIITGEIDISVGSLMGLLAIVIGQLTSPQHANWPVPLGVFTTLAVGTAIGLINGLLVTFARVPSIIVTLGMLTVLRGTGELLMGGEWITQLPDSLRFLGFGSLLGIRISLWTAIFVAAATMLLVRHTPLGRRIYAVGSNPHAATLAGISPTRIKLFVFTFTGFLTAIATVVSVPQLSTIDSGIGKGLELLVVTCVVVGGTSIKGGRGTIAGTLIGTALLGIIGTVLIFLRLGERSVYWERAIQGAFILMAILVDRFTARPGARR